MTLKRIGIMSGGGDCPGINAVIRAAAKSAIHEHGLEVHGIEDGFLGLIEDRVRPLRFHDVSNILATGGTILGTTNKADPSRFCTRFDARGRPVEFEDVSDRALATLERRGIDATLCIGGDGTMSAAMKLVKKGMKLVGVPKTIDNDIMGTDVTFGFDTAVSVATEALDRVRTTASSHHRVMLVEMMGRNAGWLTLYAGAAGGADVILIPEIPFDVETVAQVCLERSRHQKAYTLIAVAEGAKPIGGKAVVNRVVHESSDPVRLGGVSEKLGAEIARRTGLECRETILGHVQRGGIPSAADRVLATQLGHRALTMLVKGEWGRMVAYRRGEMTSRPLDEVADRQRLTPLDHPLIQACRAVATSFGEPMKSSRT